MAQVYIVTDLPGLHFRVDLECWDADQVGKDDFLGMHRIYLGQYDHDFQKYVPHRRDFANIPYVAVCELNDADIVTASFMCMLLEQIYSDRETPRQSWRVAKKCARRIYLRDHTRASR